MNTKQEFLRIMSQQSEIALATSVDNQPNVRIVNFYYDETAKVILFSTFQDNDKIKEFEENKKIAFTTIPKEGNEHVKAKGIVLKSDKTIKEVAEGFINKIPDYKDTVEQAGDFLVLYELRFETAIVTIDFENIETYSL